MRILALLLVLGACAGRDLEQEYSSDLARELAGRVAGKPRACIPIVQGTGLTIVDRRTVAYRSGGALWVNRLGDDCPGMRPLDIVVVEVHGSQYCRGDRVRALQPGTTIPGPVCLLGEFTPYRRR